MTIHRFYCPEFPLDPGAECLLPEAEARHALKVLRLRQGDTLELLDGRGNHASALLSRVSHNGREALCRLQQIQHYPVPALRWHLYLAPPRGKTSDLVLRMATELGVFAVHPVICQYGVARPEETPEAWQQVLITAIKQSRNPWLPSLAPPLPFSQALSQATQWGYYGAVPLENQPSGIQKFPEGTADLALWVGPEGGFSPAELEQLHQHGYFPLTLGCHVLRVETAVAALLGYACGCHHQ